MSFRTRRFVRPDSYLGYLTVDSYVGLFVGTSHVVLVFVGIFVGIVCRNCLSETEFKKDFKKIKEFRKIPKRIRKRYSDEMNRGCYLNYPYPWNYHFAYCGFRCDF